MIAGEAARSSLCDTRDGDNQGEMAKHRDQRTPEEQLKPAFVGQLAASRPSRGGGPLRGYDTDSHPQSDRGMDWNLSHLLLDRIVTCRTQHP